MLCQQLVEAKTCLTVRWRCHAAQHSARPVVTSRAKSGEFFRGILGETGGFVPDC